MDEKESERKQVDYKANLDDNAQGRAEIVFNLLKKGVKYTNKEFIELTSLSEEVLDKIRISFEDDQFGGGKIRNVPYSWDYVLIFDVGDDGEKNNHKPTVSDQKRKEEDKSIPENKEWTDGMIQTKFYAQIMADFQQRVEFARITTRSAKSADGKFMMLLLGITEQNLRFWADQRDADLLLDPKGAVEVGAEDKKFPLAIRTKKGELSMALWNDLYVEYHPKADERIYRSHARTPNDENFKTPFDEKTRLRIIYESITADQGEGGAEIPIEDHVADRKHPLVACFPLHNQEKLKKFDQEWIKPCAPSYWAWCPLNEIRDYFGEPVAFYFAFLTFYMRWLIAPMIVGLIFFILQLIGGKDPETFKFVTPKFDIQYGNISFVPLMGFFIIFWAVAFVDFWARNEARLRFLWGMTKYEKKAVARPQFKGEWKPDEITGMYTEQFSFLQKICRITTILSGLLVLLMASLTAVIGVLLLKDSNPNDSLLKIGLGVANGITITIFNIIYGLVAHKGNDFENHRTQQEYENMLILKGFFFKFVNSFSSLFYLAFIRPFAQTINFYVKQYNTVCRASDRAMDLWLKDLKKTDSSGKLMGTAFYKSDGCGLVAGDLEKGKCKNIKINNVPIAVGHYAISYDGWYTAENSSISGACGPSPSKRAGDVFLCPATCEKNAVIKQFNEAVLNEVFFQLVSLFGTALIVQNALEVGCPILMAKIKGDSRAKSFTSEGKEVPPESEAEKQARLSPYENTIEDMTELIVQFGYVTLFVMAFPLTPFLAFFNNVIEMKVDAINMVKQAQRPHPIGSYGLGSWNLVLQFFSMISVLTNVLMITFRTGLVNVAFQNEPGGQWIFFSILSIGLIIIVSIEKILIPDVPGGITDSLERQRQVEVVLVKNTIPEEYEVDPPGDGDEDDDGVFDFDPDAPFTDASALQTIPLENIQWGNLEASS